jgi:hypothetical protein
VVESLWPQISVSKVAVCHVPTAPDFERPLGFEPTHFEPVRDGSARRRKTNEQGRIVRYACTGS